MAKVHTVESVAAGPSAEVLAWPRPKASEETQALKCSSESQRV